MFFQRSKTDLPSADEALPGRTESPFHLPSGTRRSTPRW